MSTLSPMELVEMYSDLITTERRRIKESLEKIAEWSEKLTQAADSAASTRG